MPVTLADGTTVRFRGKIDRIDRASDGRVRVVDYKTGKYFWGRDAQFKGGTALQLAIYNHAARTAYPDSEITEAVYYYATGAGEYKRKGCACTPEVDATLGSVLSGLDQLAAAGVFPPVADNCKFCDYQTICGPFRVERARAQGRRPAAGVVPDDSGDPLRPACLGRHLDVLGRGRGFRNRQAVFAKALDVHVDGGAHPGFDFVRCATVATHPGRSGEYAE